jgi:transposase-like protein
MAAKKEKRTRRVYSDAEKAAAIARVLGGETQLAVAAQLGSHSSVISRWLKEAEAAEKKKAANDKRRASMRARNRGEAPPPASALASPVRVPAEAVQGRSGGLEEALRAFIRAEVRAALRGALGGS